MVQVPDSEGQANHTGAESCAGAGNGVGEALTGERAGRVLSPAIGYSWVPTRSEHVEGDTVDLVSARGRRMPSAMALMPLVTPYVYAASYQYASSAYPCSFPAAVCPTVQYAHALIALTVTAIISF